MRVWILVCARARELLVVIDEVVVVVVDAVDEAEKEVGAVGNDPYTCAVCVCRWSCSGRFVVLLVVVEVIVATVVVDADEVDGACMRIEGELVDVEVDGQSNEVLDSVAREVGVMLVVRAR